MLLHTTHNDLVRLLAATTEPSELLVSRIVYFGLQRGTHAAHTNAMPLAHREACIQEAAVSRYSVFIERKFLIYIN